MLKTFFIVSCVFLTIGCVTESIKEPQEIASNELEKSNAPTPSVRLMNVSLSELQVTACNTADEAGTCNTRLKQVGIVTPEECCKQLGKCC